MKIYRPYIIEVRYAESLDSLNIRNIITRLNEVGQ